jgi:phosphoesterase RecJ-like protein
VLTSSQISDFQKKLAQSKKIAVCTHYNPDGDAIGSSLALYSFFSQEFEINCVIPNNMPEFYEWMPGAENIINAQKQFKEAKKILLEADILFLVDMSAEHRSGVDLENILLETQAYKVLIDHHVNPTAKCHIICSIPGISSTCEIIPRFLAKITNEPFMTTAFGTCIYTGIITDTGSLSFACNDAETYTLLAKLMEIGVDGEEIHRKVYDNYSESRFRLLGLCLSKLKVFPHLGTSYMYLTREEMKNNNFKDGDTEGFVNYGLSLKGIYFTAFFIERDKRIRLSFRSKKGFDVNKFAQTHFNGGGHENAAAAYHYNTLENTIKYFEKIIQNLDPFFSSSFLQ